MLDELMADLADDGPDASGGWSADLRTRIARPLSVRSICRVLGLPEADGGRLVAWYDDFAAALQYGHEFRTPATVWVRWGEGVPGD